MTRLEIILALSATVLFCGCGGAPAPAPASPAQAAPTPPQTATVFSNWQFTAASTVPGKPPLRSRAVSARPAAALRSAARSIWTVQIVSTD